ncbi:MAG: DUF1501 domain-containing protein [Planctomycetes bacterium]|nr:DUF1501 domain-containing protein [Planctomycetota bacterium]
MLTVWGKRESFCDGVTRRGFLQVGAFGAGLTLAEMLRLRATAGGPRASTRTAIMIYLPGGPSHMDMYDLKPDAPKEFRGEFKPIPTNVPGVQVCEHMPMQARMWDKLAAVRSIVTVEEHSDTMVMTGFPDRVNRTAGRPSIGSVVSKVRGTGHAGVPPFVSLRNMTRGTEPGYLGIAHRPFTPSGPGAQNLRMARDVSLDRLEDRKGLLHAFDSVRREADASGTMTGMDSFATQALELVVSGKVRHALDLSKEESRSRARYKGVEQFLTARRLVEAGVGCVTLAYGGWDTHGQNFTTLKRQLPMLDRGIANMIQDLYDRGLGDEVVTVVWGEFGRTPKINRGAGRDHWPSVMSALVAGGGLRMGQMVGASTSRGERPKDSPYVPSNVLSTVYRVLGIDAAQTFPNGSGRPMYILDDRAPVKELL